MNGYIKGISGDIPNTSKEIDIDIHGKNLIITGINGSGKTSLLSALHEKVHFLIAQKKQADYQQIQSNYDSAQLELSRHKKGTTNYESWTRAAKSYQKDLVRFTEGLQVEIPDNITFSSGYDDRISIIKYFKADRAAIIDHATSAVGVLTDQDNAKNISEDRVGSKLEQHLVNLRTRRSLAITESNDYAISNRITTWFDEFDDQLKLLMEDDSTGLTFDPDTLKFSILQDGKPDYTFQNLSSGYSAIFDIYADLLMRTEYFKVTPKELTGVAFIDEIDAHLHVSLQRIIFPFLTSSFPNIQFIVTTHSPFVLMSVDDSVIFDLSSNSQVNDDLSLYPYGAILKGLLGTKPTSIHLDRIIKEISELTNSSTPDYGALQILIDKIEPIEEKLDSASKAFYMRGVNTLLDRE